MAIPISKFGQYVLFQAYTEGGDLIFETDSLRVDFDIRDIKGWSRAAFTLFNLAPTVIGKLSNGEVYITLSVSQHDSELRVIADRMYVSNAIEETIVPESVLTLYTYSKLRKKFFDLQVTVGILKPSLQRVVDQVTEAADFRGVVKCKHFPEGYLDYVPPTPKSNQRGSLIDCLENLGDSHNFNIYTEGNILALMYKPDAKNLKATSLYTDPSDVVLDTRNMRANPKIGPATLSVVSNLDPDIKPTAVLDTSNLLTSSTSADIETLFVAENYLLEKVAGFSKYQTLSVQHKGSNWTEQWMTQAMATSPSRGTNMNSNKWWL